MEVPGVKPSSWQPIARELCVRVFGRSAVIIHEALLGAVAVHAAPAIADLDCELVIRLANDGRDWGKVL